MGPRMLLSRVYLDKRVSGERVPGSRVPGAAGVGATKRMPFRYLGCPELARFLVSAGPTIDQLEFNIQLFDK
jgi:hypothetical protein